MNTLSTDDIWYVYVTPRLVGLQVHVRQPSVHCSSATLQGFDLSPRARDRADVCYRFDDTLLGLLAASHSVHFRSTI